MEKVYLKQEKLNFSKLSVVDDIGKVFYYQDKVFRGIHRDKESSIVEMFECGLVKELVEKGLIPETTISNYYSDQFLLILEHKKIENLSYVYEWTFDMIKDAARLILQLSSILLKYNYVMKDCHPYNILFENAAPIYVDLGSFIKMNMCVFPIKEFNDSYIFPLTLLKIGYPTARETLYGIEFRNLIEYKYKLMFTQLYKIILLNERFLYKIINKLGRKKYSKRFISKILISKNSKKINAFKINRNSMWSEYHHQILNNEGDLINKTPRFQRIDEIVNQLNVSSVFEIAGNSGAMSILLAKNDKIKKIICTDYDEMAINNLYNLIKENQKVNTTLSKIYPLRFNFSMRYEHINYETFSKRMCSDIVIAMAITHHLLLTQNIDIDRMMERFSLYTKRYLIVEFMPLGLWGGGEDLPSIPVWYNLEWFKKNMSKYFKIHLVEKLEKNRIVLLGEKLRQDQQSNLK